MPERGNRPAPAVTICVPTIGRTATLAATLDSIRAQSFPDYEVLILDNASVAGAQDIIRRFANNDDRISVLRVDHRIPMFDNFQRGVDQARGRYVTFFHDDD